MAFLIVGTVDFMHALSFPGMPAFVSQNSTGKAIDYWIVARLTQAAALACSGFIPTRHKHHRFIRAALTIGALVFIAVTFYVVTYLPHLIPAMFVPGEGLTPMKVWLEYTVIFITVVAIGKYALIYRQTRDRESRILLTGLTFFVFSELSFTLYASAFDIYNLLGHFFKIGATVSTLLALFVSSVQEPFTARKQAQEELRLLVKLTRFIGETPGFHSAIEFVLRGVGEATKWDYGEAWTPSDDGSALECVPVWYSSCPEEMDEFRQVSEEYKFKPNTGLPGRVWFSRQPEWIPNATTTPDEIFVRARIATETGLKAVFGVPIIAGEEVLAVLVFFISEAREEDNRLVELVSAVAAQLGEAVQRKRAEEALAEQSMYLDNILHSATEYAIAATDLEYRITYYNPMAEKLHGYKAEEVIGKTVQEMHTKEKVVPERFERAIENIRGTGEHCYTVVKETEEGRRYINVRVSGIYDSNGELAGFLNFAKDVTERKQVEEEIKAKRYPLNKLGGYGSRNLFRCCGNES